jgi:hypothetical protein
MVTDMDNSDDLGQRSALTSLYLAAMAVVLFSWLIVWWLFD